MPQHLVDSGSDWPVGPLMQLDAGHGVQFGPKTFPGQPLCVDVLLCFLQLLSPVGSVPVRQAEVLTMPRGFECEQKEKSMHAHAKHYPIHSL